MFRFLINAILGSSILLWLTNPGLDQFIEEGQKIVKKEASTVGRGWNAFSSAVGISGAAKSLGMGYEVCRRDLYLISLFSVERENWVSDDEPTAAGLGVAGTVFFYRGFGPEKPFLLSPIVSLVRGNKENLSCTSAHK